VTIKNVLITGCSSGIGACLSQKLHQQGYRVWATARNASALESLKPQGINTLSLDVTSQKSVDQAFDSLRQQNITIDTLVNNAGYAAMGPIAELPLAHLQQQFDTNVSGIVRLVQAAVPGMISIGHGKIINIGSVSGIVTTPFSGAYCASKAAVHSISDAMRMELAPFNIEVTDIRPGAIESSFGNNAMSGTEKNKEHFKLYQTIYNKIIERANASQQNPTSTEDFVNELIERAFAAKPPAIIYIGNGSTKLRVLKTLLPTKILDSALSRKFGLNALLN
jgi:short-subunit dehydrogenase